MERIQVFFFLPQFFLFCKQGGADNGELNDFLCGKVWLEQG